MNITLLGKERKLPAGFRKMLRETPKGERQRFRAFCAMLLLKNLRAEYEQIAQEVFQEERVPHEHLLEISRLIATERDKFLAYGFVFLFDHYYNEDDGRIDGRGLRVVRYNDDRHQEGLATEAARQFRRGVTAARRSGMIVDDGNGRLLPMHERVFPGLKRAVVMRPQLESARTEIVCPVLSVPALGCAEKSDAA